MQRRGDGSWELTARRVPLAWSLVAAWSLAATGALLGGIVGWVSFAFFGLMGVVLVTRLAGTRVVATFSPLGVSLATSAGARFVSWEAVEALLLWTQLSRAEGRVDRLGVVSTGDLHALGVGVSWGDPASAPTAVDPDQALAVSASLADCRVDADALRSALFALGSHAVVVDRRR
ncbi:MAG: hypothetical protein GEV08_14225 [Acidimicrobiia bacterium]|nr:hypothetical protein [Acidimicrobiia bacterium]